MPLTREQLAQRISKEIQDGFVVNLGIGIPTLVANYIPKNVNVMLHSENGLLGMGPFPLDKDVDPDLINAGKQTVTAVDGASFFSSADSFAMIRGGHVNLTVLGAMQVDVTRSIANWMVPGKMVKGMGGAMDLVAGAQRVVVAMQHVDRSGEKKLLDKCTLPITGVNCIDLVVSDFGVFSVKDKRFVLLEKAPDVSVEDIIKNTGAQVDVSPNLIEMKF
jgi:3-oxoacid CoA-transferase subunit B